MAILSAPWYASSVFWTIFIGAVASILSGVLGAWLANRYNNPKRRIMYGWPKNVSLLETTSSGANPLVISHGTSSSVLTDPRIVDIELRNLDKADIASPMFDNSDPIVFDLDADIVDILETDVQPVTAPMPSWSYSGKQIKIAPSLLKTGQIVTFSVLVDGAADDLKATFPLSGVDPVGINYSDPDWEVRARRERVRLEKFMRIYLTGFSVLCVVGVIFASGLAINKELANSRLRDSEIKNLYCNLDAVPASEKREADCPTSMPSRYR
ncbi:hypothetical protein [Streptomyces sp. NPDC058475]|uniref:hypothetical protein n=1 Tax=Streptomyces sp. NPDC058475 TaxID=3346518 RepID=UPI003653964B